MARCSSRRPASWRLRARRAVSGSPPRWPGRLLAASGISLSAARHRSTAPPRLRPDSPRDHLPAMPGKPRWSLRYRNLLLLLLGRCPPARRVARRHCSRIALFFRIWRCHLAALCVLAYVARSLQTFTGLSRPRCLTDWRWTRPRPPADMVTHFVGFLGSYRHPAAGPSLRTLARVTTW